MDIHFTIGQKLRLVRPIPSYRLKKDEEVELLKIHSSNGIGDVYLIKHGTESCVLVREDFEVVDHAM